MKMWRHIWRGKILISEGFNKRMNYGYNQDMENSVRPLKWWQLSLGYSFSYELFYYKGRTNSLRIRKNIFEWSHLSTTEMEYNETLAGILVGLICSWINATEMQFFRNQKLFYGFICYSELLWYYSWVWFRS